MISTSSLKTLVVDDDAILREVIVDFLAKTGTQVLEAANGIEALKLIQEHEPDLVISDIKMPSLMGTELINAIAALQLKKRPVIFLITGYMNITAEQARSQGAHGLLHKPFRQSDIMAIIEKTNSISKEINK